MSKIGDSTVETITIVTPPVLIHLNLSSGAKAFMHMMCSAWKWSNYILLSYWGYSFHCCFVWAQPSEDHKCFHVWFPPFSDQLRLYLLVYTWVQKNMFWMAVSILVHTCPCKNVHAFFKKSVKTSLQSTCLKFRGKEEPWLKTGRRHFAIAHHEPGYLQFSS